MPKQVRLHQLSDLSNQESVNEIFLETKIKTHLHIAVKQSGETMISFPYGNKFDVIDGKIIIYEK